MNITSGLLPEHGFELTLSKTDEGLVIDAEDQHTGVIFSLTLNDASAKAISDQYFGDIDIIFQVVKDFFENKPAGVSLSLTKDGKLTYSCQVSFGTIAKKMGFTLCLEKKIVDPMVKVERSLEKLAVRVAKIEESKLEGSGSAKIQDLEKIIKAADERHFVFAKLVLDKLEKLEKMIMKNQEKIDKLEEKEKGEPQAMTQKNLVPISISCNFNPSGAFVSDYILSNNNRTATAKAAVASSIFAQHPLPSDKISQFSFKIEEVVWLMVGIAPTSALKNKLSYTDKSTFAYGFNGEIFACGVLDTNGLTKYQKGDRITFILDPFSAKIDVTRNGSHIHTHNIPNEHRDNVFYPFVYTSGNKEGSSVTFI